MKSVFKISLLLASITFLANPTYAATSASSTVTGNVPVLNTVQSTGGSLSISVDPSNGSLPGNISTGFSVFTNNVNGINVQFNVASPSSTGAVNSSTAITAGSNTGKVILANNDSKPTSAAITNALSASPIAASNGNAIAYKIQYTGSRTNSNPLFSSASATSASIIAPVGVTTFTAQIISDNTFLANTYDNNTDYSGAYQATVNCTISSP